jgi:hypothetical protein
LQDVVQCLVRADALNDLLVGEWLVVVRQHSLWPADRPVDGLAA